MTQVYLFVGQFRVKGFLTYFNDEKLQDMAFLDIFVSFSGNNAQILAKKYLSKHNLIWILDMVQ